MKKIHVSRADYDIMTFNAVKKPVQKAKERTACIRVFLDDLISEMSKRAESGKIEFNQTEADLIVSNLKVIRKIDHAADAWLKVALAQIYGHVSEIKEIEDIEDIEEMDN